MLMCGIPSLRIVSGEAGDEQKVGEAGVVDVGAVRLGFPLFVWVVDNEAGVLDVSTVAVDDVLLTSVFLQVGRFILSHKLFTSAVAPCAEANGTFSLSLLQKTFRKSSKSG